MPTFRFPSRAVMTLSGLIAVASLIGAPTVLAADEATEHDHTHAATPALTPANVTAAKISPPPSGTAAA
jgi:hypothetical protein